MREIEGEVVVVKVLVEDMVADTVGFGVQLREAVGVGDATSETEALWETDPGEGVGLGNSAREGVRDAEQVPDAVELLLQACDSVAEREKVAVCVGESVRRPVPDRVGVGLRNRVRVGEGGDAETVETVRLQEGLGVAVTDRLEGVAMPVWVRVGVSERGEGDCVWLPDTDGDAVPELDCVEVGAKVSVRDAEGDGERDRSEAERVLVADGDGVAVVLMEGVPVCEAVVRDRLRVREALREAVLLAEGVGVLVRDHVGPV